MIENNEQSKLRLVERLDNGVWKKIRMSEIRYGDVFRLFEPDSGEQVGSLWKATEDASVVAGVAGVACEVKE